MKTIFILITLLTSMCFANSQTINCTRSMLPKENLNIQIKIDYKKQIADVTVNDAFNIMCSQSPVKFFGYDQVMIFDCLNGPLASTVILKKKTAKYLVEFVPIHGNLDNELIMDCY